MATATATPPRDGTKIGEWQQTACILCAENCGIEVQVDEDGRFTKIRGDKAHPHSRGYLCQKASRLDYYQNHADRLDSPLKRREDGTFERISWDQAISEIAAKLVELRDTHGGHSLAFCGGGGQGNHMGGIYGNMLKGVMGTHYHYSSLAQEKTGGFWVNGRIFGRQSCYPSHDVEHSDYVIFLGTNPWMSHGFARARKVLQDIKRDPNRKMIVVDPFRTKTADMADVHLAVKPGRDAYLLTAMIATIVQEGLANPEFIAEHTEGYEQIRKTFSGIDADAYVRFAGLDPEVVRAITREYAAADKATIRADLGLEHTLHSTLNDYLGKLIYLITGHFGREGTNMLLTQFLPLLGHSKDFAKGEEVARTRVTGMPEISKLFPPNVLPAEIDTDHPERTRGVVVDSMNIVATGADTHAYEEAFKKLELLVVIDVAMTETARLAHYVLPASSQYEKWEATFFGAGVPSHVFHLRPPLVAPGEGTLSEPEIHSLLVRAMGVTEAENPLLGAVAQVDALAPQFKDRSDNFKMMAAPLFLGSQRFSAKYPAAVTRAGIEGEGPAQSLRLFEAIVNNPSGVEIGEFEYEDSFKFIRHSDGKIHLAIPELLKWADELEQEMKSGALDDAAFPFYLSAGGRRSYNANTIFRDPAWRRDDRDGALWIHPGDLEKLGASDGDWIEVESKSGKVVARAQSTDSAQPGFVALPHGYGLAYSGGGSAKAGKRVAVGVPVNVLSDALYCDPIAKTPYHKNIRVRLSLADPSDIPAWRAQEAPAAAAS